LKALDTAADAARAGAPAAAAELLELAIGLGGNSPSRRIRAAEHHFKAGDADRHARCWSRRSTSCGRAGAGVALNLMAGICMYNDTFVEAAALLERALDDGETNPPVGPDTVVVDVRSGHVGQVRGILQTLDTPFPARRRSAIRR
jgi:hypothetical protein